MNLTAIIIASIVSVALNLLTIILSNKHHEDILDEKISSIKESMENINALLGNGNSEGVFVRKEIHEHLHSTIVKRLEEHTLELNLLKKFIMEGK